MPRHKLSDKFAATVKPGTEQIEYTDPTLKAFGLRVSPSGTKAWNCWFRIDGKVVRFGLGNYPTVGLAEARKRAAAAFGLVESNRDPRIEAERQRREAADERGNTIRAVADRYFAEIGATDGQPDDPPARKGRVRRGTVLRSAKEVRRILEKYVLPVIGDRPMASMARRELIALFDNIADDHGGVMANRALAWTRRLFSFAIEKAIIDASPCAGIARPAAETERQRALSHDEIREVWAAAGDLGYPFGTLFKLILLTGTRLREAGRAPWSEFDHAKAVWTIPAARYKSNVDHAIPLSPTAARLAFGDAGKDGLPVMGDYLFSTQHGRAIGGFAYSKAALDRAIMENRRKENARAKPMDHWTPHDLRRTVATQMGELGIADEVIDRCLGHKRGRLQRTYNTSEGLPAKRAAFERWALHLAGIVEGPSDNVVQIRGA